MSTRIRATVWTFVAAAAISGTAFADESPTGTMPPVLLLRNGHVLRGAVTPAGDTYLVISPSGGKIVVPVADVEMTCRSIHEAYIRKRQSLIRHDAASHLGLAEWCMRQQLPAQAADQILAAFVLEPNNPQVATSEQRLFLEESKGEVREPSRSALPKGPTLQEIDDTVRALPGFAVERFVNTIQPFMLSRCAGNSCHGFSSSNDFRLIRPRTGETMTSRSTRRNLWAVLQRVNANNPKDSELLTIAQQPHGTTSTLISPGDRYYDQLVAWIASVSISSNSKSVPMAYSPGKQDVHLDTNVKPASHTASIETAGRTSENGRSAKPARGVPRGAPQVVNFPKANETTEPDPLDPELFNTQFLKTIEK